MGQIKKMSFLSLDFKTVIDGLLRNVLGSEFKTAETD